VHHYYCSLMSDNRLKDAMEGYFATLVLARVYLQLLLPNLPSAHLMGWTGTMYPLWMAITFL
jgi:hypothetical protein